MRGPKCHCPGQASWTHHVKAAPYCWVRLLMTVVIHYVMQRNFIMNEVMYIYIMDRESTQTKIVKGILSAFNMHAYDTIILHSHNIPRGSSRAASPKRAGIISNRFYAAVLFPTRRRCTEIQNARCMNVLEWNADRRLDSSAGSRWHGFTERVSVMDTIDIDFACYWVVLKVGDYIYDAKSRYIA